MHSIVLRGATSRTRRTEARPDVAMGGKFMAAASRARTSCLQPFMSGALEKQ
mgnify:CR=1 FL=1